MFGPRLNLNILLNDLVTVASLNRNTTLVYKISDLLPPLSNQGPNKPLVLFRVNRLLKGTRTCSMFAEYYCSSKKPNRLQFLNER